LGTISLVQPHAADANGDGVVNVADYTIWQSALSAQPAVVPPAIPEISAPDPGPQLIEEPIAPRPIRWHEFVDTWRDWGIERGLGFDASDRGILPMAAAVRENGLLLALKDRWESAVNVPEPVSSSAFDFALEALETTNGDDDGCDYDGSDDYLFRSLAAPNVKRSLVARR
jgi:hypothetical protein